MRVFENRVLRKIFVPKRDEVTGERRRLHNKELYALYSSPNITRVMKSRTLKWTQHVACKEDRKGAYRVLVGKPEGSRIILKWIFEKWVGRKWTGSIWLRTETGGGLL